METAVESGLVAFTDLDEAGFGAAHGHAHDHLDCMGDKLLPLDVGALHRLDALNFFLADEPEDALRSFRAALVAQPNHSLRETVAPAGGKLFRLYEQAQAADPPRLDPVWMSGDDLLYINGHRGTDMPVDVPAVVQVVGSDGVRWTGWLAPGQAVPPDVLGPPAAPEPEVVAQTPAPTQPVGAGAGTTASTDNGAKQGLLVGAAVSGLAAAGLYGGAAALRMRYEDDPTASGRQATNTVYMASMGLTAVTVTLGGVAVVLP